MWARLKKVSFWPRQEKDKRPNSSQGKKLLDKINDSGFGNLPNINSNAYDFTDICKLTYRTDSIILQPTRLYIMFLLKYQVESVNKTCWCVVQSSVYNINYRLY